MFYTHTLQMGRVSFLSMVKITTIGSLMYNNDLVMTRCIAYTVT